MSIKNLPEQNLYIHEIYPSVQGETTLSGVPTVFIRLSACNLRCTWCDTPQAFGRGNPLSINNIVSQVQEYGLSYVCVTGGEPLLQEGVHLLMKTLSDCGFTVSIETGGSLTIKEIDSRVITVLDIKCPGSGMESHNLWENFDYLKKLDEIKFVLADRQDYEYAIEICNQYHLFKNKQTVLFSPVHNVLDPQLLVKWIVADQIPVRINIQIHKYIWTPETLGV